MNRTSNSSVLGPGIVFVPRPDIATADNGSVQFNDSTVHQPTGGAITIPAANNGSNLVTFKNKPGFSPTIDGQLVPNTVLNINGSNVEWNGINVVNPIDVSKLRVAGAELKEAFLPVDMIWGSFEMYSGGSSGNN